MNEKNYKVVCRRLGYWGDEKWRAEYYYNWYWCADLRSWFMHHFFDLSCNTYVRNGAVESGKVKPRPVVWK